MRKRGQFRIIETLISTFIIISAFIIAVNLQDVPRTWIMREKKDLEDMAFNLLTKLINMNILDNVLNAGDKWELEMLLVLKTLLPPMIYFNLSIYEIHMSNNGTIQFKILNKNPITNILREDINKIGEIASASYIYTKDADSMYLIVLMLARSRGG